MSEHLYIVTAHTIPAAHIRGLSRGIQDEQNGQLRIALKHYVPRYREPQPGDPTLILGSGIGCPKECHEPLLDAILDRLAIRGAWTCDVTHHGASYVLNENIIGDEPHYLDSPRDMLHMINTFSSEIFPPIYGIGQSWGCSNSMALIEPFFDTERKLQAYRTDQPAKASEYRIRLLAKRRDTWPSRDEAAAKLRATPFYAAFDPRVFDLMVKYGLRDMPTELHPHAVTLTTPKAQEVYLYARPDPPFPGYEAAPDYHSRTADNFVAPGFYSAEVKHRARVLGQVRPPTLLLWGTESDIGNSAYPESVLEQIGTGDEGNGGVAAGKVQSKYVQGAHHTVHLEMPGKAAEAIGEWLKENLEMWRDEMKSKVKQPPFNPGVLNPLWLERLSKL